ncbi:hypothetical protein A3B56_01665 [Candidatus Roizmanbacteria bacterium RIFCSPLOWO2_01_FULL_45_11]|uniref:CYTH domain-containing protein n=1 Tax=Candidatus Roizmanbacteria bacterium RIFCSPLOWO2_01_FULL_45_11 TaxID=1802070 RepID=A0A1F7JFA1_9BACT|nr:MAG: hypothetical protein A3B56_01665 [Candidatus Roizmanbacteria bacterium RIFCSPLOWO2_01_FULL_45_11]
MLCFSKMQTITRKFLVKDIPDLSHQKAIQNNRFYLFISEGLVIRVQNNGDTYEIERKVDISELIREKHKIEISKEEFEALSNLTNKNISRDSYLISEKPRVTLKIYHNNFEGLVRAEVSFDSIEEAQNFKPLDWFNKEITNSPLAKDETLSNLSIEEFRKLLI